MTQAKFAASPLPLTWHRQQTARPKGKDGEVAAIHDTHLCVDVGDLLDRAPVARASVLGGDDAAISALPELLHELVLRIDDERRVESGETVPLHGARVCHRLCLRVPCQSGVIKRVREK